MKQQDPSSKFAKSSLIKNLPEFAERLLQSLGLTALLMVATGAHKKPPAFKSGQIISAN